MDELIINLEEDIRVNVPGQADEAVVNYSEDILVHVRQGHEVSVELTHQGPQGPQGPIGDVTPAAIAARDTAVAAKVAAQTAQAAAELAEDNALASKTAAEAAQVAAEGARDVTVGARDTAIAARDDAQTASTDAQAAQAASEAAQALTETARDAAAASAADASAQRSLAETAKTASETARDASAASATAAEDSAQTAVENAGIATDKAASATQSFIDITDAILALGLPAVHVASNFLRRKADNSGFEYIAPTDLRTAIDAEPARNTVSQAIAEAGVETVVRGWTAQRVRQAIAAYAATKIHTHEIEEINGLLAALDLLAAKESPALTGNPTAPTQLLSDDSTRLATTAFVKLVINDVIAAAPGALDTLNELAAALGDDPNFATTITDALAGKAALIHSHEQTDINGLIDALAALAPKASPALTGNPTAPTPAAGDDSASLATTAFVAVAVADMGAAKADLVHVHAIADVTDLQGILDAIQMPRRPAAPAATNLNTVIVAGTYYFGVAEDVTTALNFPSAGRTGRLQVDRNYDGSHLWQEYFDDTTTNSWHRVSSNGGTSWTAWANNFNTYIYGVASQALAEAGTSTLQVMWSSLRVRQNVAAYAAPIEHVHVIADVTGLEDELAAKVVKGYLSGGIEQALNGNSAITAAHNGYVLVSVAETASTWTLDAPATIGDEFLVFISNTGLGDLTIAGTFDNGETEIKLEQGQSMALTSNGVAHRLLLRGGGAGGGGSVIPLRETIQGNGGAVYNLTNTPASKDAMLVFVGGVVQSKDSFEIAGNQLTLSGNVAADEKIEVLLLKGGASVVGVAPLYKKHAGTGSAGPFTLQAAPAVNEALMITWNGLIQPKDGTAYTYVGDQLTFSESIPVGTYWEEVIVQAVGIGVPNPETVGALELKTSDVAEIRTKLDVAPKQSGIIDATVGRGLIVGAFGLGGTDVPQLPSGTDLNTINTDGHYYVSGPVNGPPDGVTGFVEVIPMGSSGSGRGLQRWTSVSSEPIIWQRAKINGAYGSWRPVWTGWSAMRPVSNAGGYPSGGLIERGSNSNGEYVKFADGTLVCSLSAVVAVTTTSSYIVTDVLPFPAAFASVPTCHAVWNQTTGDATNSRATTIYNYLSYPSVGACRFGGLLTTGTPTAGSQGISYIAFGRWF